LVYLRENFPTRHTTIALVEQALADIEKTWLIVKARRLTVAAINTVAPSYLQQRVVRGLPLPRVAMTPLTIGQDDVDGEEGRKFRTLIMFFLGVGGGLENESMPRDVFRVVMDFLMPAWDPLRRGVAGARPQMQG
jgi:hypothetical protein